MALRATVRVCLVLIHAGLPAETGEISYQREPRIKSRNDTPDDRALSRKGTHVLLPEWCNVAALQSDIGARDRRLRRLSTSPASVAAQARTAMIMNSCDNGSRNGAARIFARWYVATEYMPNGNTPPQ